MDLSSHLTETFSVVEALAGECLLDMGFLPFIFVTRMGKLLRYMYLLTALIPIRNYGIQAYPWQWSREIVLYCLLCLGK